MLLRLTDAEFLYTPSQIALAAFYNSDPSLTERWLSAKLSLAERSILRQASESAIAVDRLVESTVDPLVSLVTEAKQAVDIEAVREVDKRLKYCNNPEKDPKSSLFKKREIEKEETEERKREKKMETKKKEDGEEDPFA